MSFTLTLTAALLGAADWSVTDVDGKIHQPFADEKTRAVVLVFISTDCPIANAYHPELRRLQKEFEPKGFRFMFAHPDPDVTVKEAREHAREYGITAPVVRDPDHVLVKRTGASVTPEAAVMTSDGTIAYRGRIDDLYVTWGKKRPEATKRELREALTALTTGKEVPVARTKPIGCYIPELTEEN